MTLPIPAFLRRPGRLVLIAGFGLLLALQAALHAPMIMRDAPYEGWDEVTTYNGARVLTGPTAHWAYRYGTLDTLLQLAALDYFLTFDPAGAEYRHIAYANNDPGSLNNEFYAFRGIQPDDLGYAYFRGIDDHRPITLSRELHFAAFYGLVALAGLLWIWLLGAEAIWLLLPMLCLTIGTEVFLQAAFSLPNAINAMLSFGIVASLCLARALDRPRLLYLAAALLGVALNFKIDMLPLGFVLGLALLLQDRRAGLRPVLRRCLIAGMIFVVALIATDPLLIIDPAVALKFLLPPPVHHTAGDTGPAERLVGNLLPFARALKWDLLPDALQFWVPTIILPIVLLLATALVVFLLRRRPALLRPLGLPVLAALLLWLPPLLLTQDYYERYVLNGVAALYALAGVALLGFRRSGDPTARRVAALLALLLLGQYGVLARDGIGQADKTTAESMMLWGKGNSGWSQAQTRNIVEWRAVETFLAGGYDRTVLVDQHAYLDLRPLRLAGLTPVFVNLDTLDQALATLDPAAPHLLLYSTGNYEPDPAWWRPWMSRWSPETARRYDAYRAVIDGFPVLHDTGGPAQRLLWTGPVGPSDRMILAAVPPIAIQRETR